VAIPPNAVDVQRDVTPLTDEYFGFRSLATPNR
jgi:hypothetical protein